MKEGNKGVLITGMIILGVIILALILIGFLNNSGGYDNTISSTGESTIKVLPDFATVYFNVQTTGQTASEASDKNSEIVSKMKNALVAIGFKEDEIKTQSFSVYPDYDWSGNTQRIKGYSATHMIVVEVPITEKEKIGKVIDAGISSGAGINYINYELSEENQNKYKIEAIKVATQDATNKAEAIAEGSGTKLGKLVSISTSEFGYIPWLAYSEDASGGVVKSGAEIATTITPSEQEISARVTAVFRIA